MLEDFDWDLPECRLVCCCLVDGQRDFVMVVIGLESDWD